MPAFRQDWLNAKPLKLGSTQAKLTFQNTIGIKSTVKLDSNSITAKDAVKLENSKNITINELKIINGKIWIEDANKLFSKTP